MGLIEPSRTDFLGEGGGECHRAGMSRHATDGDFPDWVWVGVCEGKKIGEGRGLFGEGSE